MANFRDETRRERETRDERDERDERDKRELKLTLPLPSGVAVGLRQG